MSTAKLPQSILSIHRDHDSVIYSRKYTVKKHYHHAWDNLRNQYENKRILINNQLRIYFRLGHCGHQLANVLKELQRDISNCILVFELKTLHSFSPPVV